MQGLRFFYTLYTTECLEQAVKFHIWIIFEATISKGIGVLIQKFIELQGTKTLSI
jgi:hypothetical protein